MLVAAIPAKNLGIAIKITDGGNRARSIVLLSILDHLGILSAEEKDQLKAHVAPTIENSRGVSVGEIRPASSWLSKLNKINKG